MAEKLWKDFVQAAIGSEEFSDGLEVCLKALADEAQPAFGALGELAQALQADPVPDEPSELIAPLTSAIHALVRVQEVLGQVAELLEAAGGQPAPAIGPIDPADIEAAASKARAIPGGTRVARHASSLRRAAYGAAGHLERMLKGPDGEGEQALTDLITLAHQTQAGLHQSHRILAAARCLFQEPGSTQA